MRFSILFAAPVPGGAADDERAVLRSCVEQAVSAEKYGFHRVWVMEHHGLSGYGHISAPDVVLSWIGARTSTLRLGVGVAMPPAINHPIRVAERVALLDVLSGGRVDIAASGGRSGCEAALFGNDVSKVEEERDLAPSRIARLWRDAPAGQPAVCPVLSRCHTRHCSSRAGTVRQPAEPARSGSGRWRLASGGSSPRRSSFVRIEPGRRRALSRLSSLRPTNSACCARL